LNRVANSVEDRCLQPHPSLATIASKWVFLCLTDCLVLIPTFSPRDRIIGAWRLCPGMQIWSGVFFASLLVRVSEVAYTALSAPLMQGCTLSSDWIMNLTNFECLTQVGCAPRITSVLDELRNPVRGRSHIPFVNHE